MQSPKTGMMHLSPLRRGEPARRSPWPRLLVGLPAALLLLGALLYGGWLWREEYRRSHAYDTLIREAARRYGLPPCLVKGLIRQESRFRADTTGHSGEIGLMQIMPGAIQDWERTTGRRCQSRGAAYDPRLNLEIGCWYLALAMRRWDGRADRWEMALAQYNAGPANAARWGRDDAARSLYERVRFPSTRRYIKNVLEYARNYERQHAFDQ